MDLAFASGNRDVVQPVADEIMRVFGPMVGHFPWRRLAEYGSKIDSHKSRSKGEDE